MRVTHVITRLIVGGAQENTIASVLGLRQRHQLEVDLISGPTRGSEGSLESEFADCPDILGFIPTLVRPVHPWKDLSAFRQLTSEFAARKPEIVHTHSGKAGVLGRLAAARAGIPIIIHTIHGPSFGPFQGHFANWVFRTAERRAARVTRHFVTVADAMTQQYLAAGIGRPDQYTRVFSGFPLEPFLRAGNDPLIRERYGLHPEDFVVGKIARLFELKGHDELIAAASQLVRVVPRVRFLLVGNGPWRQRLEQKIINLGLRPYFVFTGLVPPTQIPELVGIMDALVHLSQREGLPRALPQALAAGKPVVAYDCDGAREACQDGITGFLVRNGHLNGIVERLTLLARDVSLRVELGRNGQSFARANFPVEKMVDGLYALYQKLARQH